jgi:zinc protease
MFLFFGAYYDFICLAWRWLALLCNSQCGGTAVYCDRSLKITKILSYFVEFGMFGASVFKKILLNGLTVLVLPRHDIPKVSIQIWYNVGSKNEGSGLWDEKRKEWVNERGIAHLIEHMIFKGTECMTESDINVLTYRLSGSCNAFTSHDYTGYLFDVPSQHWFEVLPVMADCMLNCTFKQELLNSELKAVVQEIKMYNDDYVSTLIEKMTGAIFYDHPYHHPVIGYKQDLWGLKSENLRNFYNKHYGPNNATLVVVGDVDPEDVFRRAEEQFGSLPVLKDYKKQEFYHSHDIAAQNVTIYRDVQQPIALFAWEVPGSKDRKEYLIDLMSWTIGAGKGARLYNKLVTEMGIATELQSFSYDLFDYGLFFIYVQPNNLDDLPKIKAIILEEIEHYRTNPLSDQELERAQKKTEMDFLTLNENNEKQAYLLGKTYLATGDENYLLTYCDYPQENIKKDIQNLFKQCFVPSLMHTGQVWAIEEQDRDLWLDLQHVSDQEDARILDAIVREDGLEEAVYANSVTIEKPQNFTFSRAEKFTLSNGLTVLYHNKPGTGKIDLVMDLKDKHFYDAPESQGLSMLMTDLLQEGTQKYTSQELALELESLGMELNTFPGQMGMTMLKGDAQKGLEIFNEVMMHPTFKPEDIERVRNQVLAELKMFWDEPKQFSSQLLREIVYKNHPYSQNIMGTEKAVKAITRDDLIAVHKRSVSPKGARLALVGDLTGYDVKKLLESTLGSWTGPEVADKEFPKLAAIICDAVNYPINRDQVVLSYGGLSVDRFNPDYDKLLLFDQVFTGGVLGGMNSRLFALREQTGLFYSIGGSLLAGANSQPGMVYVKTIVSRDRLAQAEQVIEAAIAEGASQLTEQELQEAQQALINSMVDNFASNRSMATTFIVLDKYGLPENYFDIRPGQLCAITVNEVKTTVSKYLDKDKLVKLRIGRL